MICSPRRAISKPWRSFSDRVLRPGPAVSSEHEKQTAQAAVNFPEFRGICFDGHQARLPRWYRGRNGPWGDDWAILTGNPEDLTAIVKKDLEQFFRILGEGYARKSGFMMPKSRTVAELPTD